MCFVAENLKRFILSGNLSLTKTWIEWVASFHPCGGKVLRWKLSSTDVRTTQFAATNVPFVKQGRSVGQRRLGTVQPRRPSTADAGGSGAGDWGGTIWDGGNGRNWRRLVSVLVPLVHFAFHCADFPVHFANDVACSALHFFDAKKKEMPSVCRFRRQVVVTELHRSFVA